MLAVGTFNWIDDLSPDARAAVLARARVKALADGTILYRQGDITTDLFQIVVGEIRKYVLTPDGQEVLLYIYGAGDVVADSSAIDRDPYPVTISTRGAARLRFWSVEDFAELRQAFTEIDSLLALQMSRRLRGALLLAQELVTLDASARVAARIAALTDLQGSVRRDQPIALSQSDLGLMVGITRQSVNQILNELKALQLIDAHYGRITVRDLTGLKLYAARSRKP